MWHDGGHVIAGSREHAYHFPSCGKEGRKVNVLPNPIRGVPWFKFTNSRAVHKDNVFK